MRVDEVGLGVEVDFSVTDGVPTGSFVWLAPVSIKVDGVGSTCDEDVAGIWFSAIAWQPEKTVVINRKMRINRVERFTDDLDTSPCS